MLTSYVCIYVYTHMSRERERENDYVISNVCMYVYVYICTHTHNHMCVMRPRHIINLTNNKPIINTTNMISYCFLHEILSLSYHVYHKYS